MKQIDLREAPDDFWETVAPFLEPFKRKRSGGKPPLFLEKYRIRLDTKWQAMDGSLVRAPVRAQKISG